MLFLERGKNIPVGFCVYRTKVLFNMVPHDNRPLQEDRVEANKR